MLSVSALPIPCSGESGGVLDLGEVELDFFVLVVDILHDRLYFMQAIVRGRRGRSLLSSDVPRSSGSLCKEEHTFLVGERVFATSKEKVSSFFYSMEDWPK